MHKDNKPIKNFQRSGHRLKIAQQLCEQTPLTWDEEVCLMNIPLVEEALDCNIYVVNLVETMLGSCCINLWEALMYKSHYREKEQHWLLFDRNHYHVITNIRGFLAVRHFCNLCFKCSDKKGTHERHQCKAKEGPKDNGSMIKDISHYLRAEYCKGSKAELSARLPQVVSARTAAKITQQSKNPKYIIYDFETDTHRSACS
jgi:hypothetical protein